MATHFHAQSPPPISPRTSPGIGSSAWLAAEQICARGRSHLWNWDWNSCAHAFGSFPPPDAGSTKARHDAFGDGRVLPGGQGTQGAARLLRGLRRPTSTNGTAAASPPGWPLPRPALLQPGAPARPGQLHRDHRPRTVLHHNCHHRATGQQPGRPLSPLPHESNRKAKRASRRSSNPLPARSGGNEPPVSTGGGDVTSAAYP
jgi:hypothetical protein